MKERKRTKITAYEIDEKMTGPASTAAATAPRTAKKKHNINTTTEIRRPHIENVDNDIEKNLKSQISILTKTPNLSPNRTSNVQLEMRSAVDPAGANARKIHPCLIK